MEGIEKSKELPIGTGQEFQKVRDELRLPTHEVLNTVTYINPEFKEAPFKLERGKATNLGIFFTPSSKVYPDEKLRKPMLMPENRGGRSGLLGAVIFKDRDGNLYRDIDVKGIGVFTTSGYKDSYLVDEVEPKGNEPRQARGLMDYEFAFRDLKYSERFLKAGIRTHRVVAILDLEQIIDFKGRKISIEEARLFKKIPQEMHPVIQVRAFGTKERIDYLLNASLDRNLEAVMDAKAMVAQELGKNPDQFTLKEYLGWFSKTLAVQVARIRKLKLYHGYLTAHNVTLDSRIVDLDSVVPVKEKVADSDGDFLETDLYIEDYEKARASLSNLVDCLFEVSLDLERGGVDDATISKINKEELWKEASRLYEESYTSELKIKKVKAR